MPTLELIARQTGKPINFFLAGDGARSAQNPAFAGAIAEAERLLALDDHKAVIALLQPLAERDTDLSTQAYMSLYLGQAHTRLHHPDPAQTLLRRARELLEGIGDRWLLVECLDWEGAALYLSEDPRALPTVQEALRRCRELRPIPAATEARILGHLANIQVAEHDWDRAISTYEKALEAAGALRDLGRMARMHDGLRTAYTHRGNNSRAGRQANRHHNPPASSRSPSCSSRISICPSGWPSAGPLMPRCWSPAGTPPRPWSSGSRSPSSGGRTSLPPSARSTASCASASPASPATPRRRSRRRTWPAIQPRSRRRTSSGSQVPAAAS